MKGIRFEKVSYEQFKKDLVKSSYWAICNNEEKIKGIYDNIKLPQRSTSGSAGYDFMLPSDIIINKNDTTLIPTGIRAVMPNNIVLCIVPRSGQGFKYGLKLVNTIGVIDSDYAYSDNEGHIMLKISHTIGDPLLDLKGGKGFAQGIFVEYCVTEDDEADGVRNGGFGSTDR